MKNSKKMDAKKLIQLPPGVIPKQRRRRGNSYSSQDFFEGYKDKFTSPRFYYAGDILEESINDYFLHTSSPIPRETAENIAETALKLAINHHHLRRVEKKQDRNLVRSYVDYALLMADLAGGKFMTIDKLHIKQYLNREGKLDITKVFLDEGGLFGITPSLERDTFLSRQVIRQEFNSSPQRNYNFSDLNSIYFLTRYLQGRLNSPLLNPQLVYESLKVDLSKKGYNVEKPSISLDEFLTLRKALKENQDNLGRYGEEGGVYFLIKDSNLLKKQGVKMHGVHPLISSTTQILSLIGINNPQNIGNWNPKKFTFDFDQMETIVTFLETQYRNSQKKFIDSYGDVNGDFNLALDLALEGLPNLDLSQLHQITANASTIESLLALGKGVISPWAPAEINLNLVNANRVREHLTNRYQQNPELFFEIYGSRLGAFIIGKELQTIYGTDYNLENLSTFLQQGQLISKIMGSVDERFEDLWKVKQLVGNPRGLENALMTLKSDFLSDKKRFMVRYFEIKDPLALLQGRIQGDANLEEVSYLFESPKLLGLLFNAPTQSITAKTAKQKFHLNPSYPQIIDYKSVRVEVVEEQQRYIAQIKQKDVIAKQIGIKKIGTSSSEIKMEILRRINLGLYDKELNRLSLIE